MVGDKRKGKAVAEPKKKKTRQQKEWERVLAVPDTQGQSQRGIRISEGTRSQGSSPRVSSSSRQSSRLNTQPQPIPRQRRAVAEELTEREQQALTPSSPEVLEKRLSEFISVTSVTCRG
jgi:hypothetical protein